LRRCLINLAIKIRKLAPALLGLALLAGCDRGFRLDMHIQPKLKPLRQSDFWGDERGSRPVIAGTVARGQLRDDTYFYTGMIAGKEGDQMPFPVTKEVLERGRQRYNIYCSPCHSYVGDGNGMIVQRGYRKAASFHDPKLMAAPIGHFYDVMTNGFGAMPDYAAQISPTDRWNISAYIRALQLSQHATQAMVPTGTDLNATAGAESQGTEKK